MNLKAQIVVKMVINEDADSCRLQESIIYIFYFFLSKIENNNKIGHAKFNNTNNFQNICYSF